VRQWRVGTISLGFSLIFGGIALLIWQVSGQPAPLLLLKWWPSVLVILGLEVLTYTFQLNKERPVLKYDLASICLIFVLVGATLVLSFFSSVGLTEYVRQAILGLY
jgi:hypothetical protein